MTASPPRWLLALSAVAVIAALAMTTYGGWVTGTAWDETYHVIRLRTFLDNGWFLLPHVVVDGRPIAGETDQFVYAPVTMLLLQSWTLLWGVDGASSVAASADAYAVRHLGVALIGAVGVGAVAALVRLILGSWRWGLVGAAVVAALPMWTGQSMFNIKDVPVAVGFTLATLGAGLVVSQRRLVGVLVLVVGVVLSIGTRPGIWAGVVGVLLLAALLDRRARTAAALGGGLVAALLVLVPIYPAIFTKPWQWLPQSVSSSGNFHGSSSPWWYVPTRTVQEIPTLLLLAAVIGSVWALRRWRRSLLSPEPAALVAILVGAQATALPLLAMLRQSHLYQGLRQLLFMGPAIAVLATVGIAAVLSVDHKARRVLAASVVAAIGVPLLLQARMFPYNYAAASALSTAVAGPHIPTDYWRTSVRELAPQIPKGGFVVCSPLLVDGIIQPRAAESDRDCASDLVGPLAPYADERHAAAPLPDDKFYAVIAGWGGAGSNCTQIGRVTRQRNLAEKTMSAVWRCTKEMP